ncbi:hypothetical protein Tco_1172835 [Tanacetum coccineum]
MFQKILDICPRVKGVDFAEVLNDETTLTFLLDLGNKGPLHKHPSMYVDHMHQPWRTLVAIINKCFPGKTANNDRLRKSRIHILWGMFYRENVDYPKLIWEDFSFQSTTVRIGEDFQEYGLPIPKTMLTEGINRGKGSQGKKTTDTSKADVDVFKESDSELPDNELAVEELSRRKSQFFADDNILLEPDVALELGKSISLSKTTEEEAARKVHATHARIVTEFVPEPARRRPSGVPDESIVIPATLSVGTEDDDDDENIDWVDTDEEEEKDDDDDDKSIDVEKIDDEETDDESLHSEENIQDDDEETNDELVHADEQVNDDEDEEMTKAEDADTGNTDEEITDTAKVQAEKTEVEKDDIKKAELPPTSSSLSASSVFGNQFLNVSSNTSLIVYVISEPSVLTPIPETPSVAPATALLPPLIVSSISHLKEADNITTLCASLRSKIPSAVNAYLGSNLGDALEKVKNQLPKFLRKAVSDFATLVIQIMVKNALENTTLLVAQSSSQARSSLKVAESLSKYKLKTILFDKIDKILSYLTNDKHQDLFDVLLNSILLVDAVARAQADLEKVLRKRDHDDEDPSVGPNEGKSPVKTSKSGKSMTAEELVEEPVFEMASDDIEQTVDAVVNDADQLPDDLTQTKDKDPKKDWFKQTPRPPTPDQE